MKNELSNLPSSLSIVRKSSARAHIVNGIIKWHIFIEQVIAHRRVCKWVIASQIHSFEFQREPFKRSLSIYEWKPQKRSINSIKNHRTARESFFRSTHCFNYEQLRWMKSLTDCELFMNVSRDLWSIDENYSDGKLREQLWLSLFGAKASVCSLWRAAEQYDEWMSEWMKSSCLHNSPRWSPSRFNDDHYGFIRFIATISRTLLI